MSRLMRRAGLVVTTTTLAGLIGLAPITPATAATGSERVDSAAGWLATQLSNGLVHNDQYDFDDYGLTADAGLGLIKAGSNPAMVRQISHALAQRVDAYVTGSDPAELYAGSTAKLATFAQASGGNPRSFGGVDLIARLESTVASNAPIAGRISDTSQYGDYANTFGQAYAARALSVAGSPKAAAATEFLLAQQCASGFFRIAFNADSTAAAQGCVEGQPGSEPDVDATALAVVSLTEASATGSLSGPVRAAVDKATAWLIAQQHADGSFGGSATTPTSNTNSTGLAAWALANAGACTVAGKAAGWIGGLQLTSGAEAGAVAYDSAGLVAGIDPATRDQWRRATAQAIGGLTATLGSTTGATLTSPTGFHRAEDTVTWTLSGAAPGSRFCFGAPMMSGYLIVTADASGSYVHTEKAGNPEPGFTLTGASGPTLVATPAKVLRKLTIPATLKKKVKRGKKQVVKVTGLAAGESVTVKYGAKKRTGTADAQGRFTATFKVKKKAKLGKAKIKVTGEFPDIRKRTLTFRVRK